MRRFVIVGRHAASTEDFLIDDLPGTSGRLDALVACVRAALLFSHGIRRDTVVDLVLLGGPLAPRTVRFDGAAAKWLRPDERQLAILLRKMLATRDDERGDGFVLIRQGISLARGGVDLALDGTAAGGVYLLDERGSDLREAPGFPDDTVFFLGDHHGLAADAVTRLEEAGARTLSVGPTSVHAADAIAIVVNELDRREATAARQPRR